MIETAGVASGKISDSCQATYIRPDFQTLIDQRREIINKTPSGPDNKWWGLAWQDVVYNYFRLGFDIPGKVISAVPINNFA